MKKTRIFSDIDLNFTPHPVTGDISMRYDDNAIKQALKNLIMTRNYERPFHSDLGSPIRNLMFEPFNPMTAHMVKRAIIDLISNYEPRVRLLGVDVIVSEDNNALYVTVQFRIVNTERPLTLDVILERTR